MDGRLCAGKRLCNACVQVIVKVFVGCTQFIVMLDDRSGDLDNEDGRHDAESG